MAVAFLAQVRRSSLEQVGDSRAMRVVADGAIFSHRLVVMDERTAFLRVAHVAGLVDTVLLQLLRTSRAVRIVAV